MWLSRVLRSNPPGSEVIGCTTAAINLWNSVLEALRIILSRQVFCLSLYHFHCRALRAKSLRLVSLILKCLHWGLLCESSSGSSCCMKFEFPFFAMMESTACWHKFALEHRALGCAAVDMKCLQLTSGFVRHVTFLRPGRRSEKWLCRKAGPSLSTGQVNDLLRSMHGKMELRAGTFAATALCRCFSAFRHAAGCASKPNFTGGFDESLWIFQENSDGGWLKAVIL